MILLSMDKRSNHRRSGLTQKN